MVSESGPGITLIVLIVMLFIFLVPVALVSAELTGRYAESGGNLVCVRTGLFEFWDFQAGWWTCRANILITTRVTYNLQVLMSFTDLIFTCAWVGVGAYVWLLFEISNTDAQLLPSGPVGFIILKILKNQF